MKRKAYFLCLLLFAVPILLQAQRFTNKRSQDPFRNTQAFIGLFGGVNFTSPSVERSFSDFSHIDATLDNLITDEKEYHQFVQNAGSHFGLSAAFSFNRNLSLLTSPAYKSMQYQYQSNFIWDDSENPDNYLEHFYDHQQKLHYLSFPIIFRFSPIGKKFRPYIQAGAHFDRLLYAQKVMNTRGIDRASGGQVEFQFYPQSNEITQLFIKSHLGLLAGAGLTYNMGTLLLFLDAQYRYGMHSIANAQTRYSGSRDLQGFGNVMDDVALRNLEISFGCYFPLKFLTKDFSPVIL